MKRVWRRSWLGSSHPLWIALPLLILLLSVGGYLVTSEAIDRDRSAAAERRARAESVETQQILGRARAYVQGLSDVLASERRPGQTRFATLAAGTAASVGLDDVLWIEEVPGAARLRYERRLGAPIGRLTSSGRVVRAPDAASYLPATFTSESRPELRPGVDVSNFPGLADAVRDRATVFAVGASRPGALGDEPGFYLLQSASFGRTRGFLAAFVPGGWFVTTIGEDPRRIAISLEGRRIEGQLSSGAGTAGFETLGRRWEIDVGREPPSSLQSTLPWLALAWPVAIALIAYLVGRAVMLRRRAEREASGMFERSTDLLASAGFDGYYRRVNPAFMGTLGYSNAEMLSKPYTEFLHPDDLERTREAFAGMVRGGEEVIGFENRWICADGSVRWIQWNVRSALDEDVMYGVGRDVTESRRAERQFEEIFNVSPDLLCIIGLDGYFKRVNSAFEEAFGYSSEELLSRPVLEFGHPDDLPMARDMFERAARGETVTRFENRNIRADGTYLWMEWTARPLPEEGVIYAAARDITERKRAESELHEARATVEASRAELAVYADEQAALRRVAVLVAQQPSPSEVFTAVTQAVGLLLDADLAVLHVFPGDGTATTIASWSGDGPILPIGSSVTPTIFESGAPARHASTRRGSVRQRVTRFENRNIRADGTYLWMEWTARPLPEEGVIYAAARDITERKRADAEQAALRRVATMVAQGASTQDLFGAVAEEVGRLLPVASATMGRFEPDDSVTSVASWSTTTEAAFPIGMRWPAEGTNVAGIVLRTGRTARIDDFSAATDPIGVTVREAGIKSAVGSPIVVKGHLWGVIAAASTEEPMPPDSEARLASFTELVATAIANAESRAELDVHVEQQAALRRVATLVAGAVPPGEIISAVAEEIGLIAPTEAAHIYRYESDGTAVRVAAWSDLHDTLPLGERLQPEGHNLVAMVWETGRAARVDDASDVTGAATEIVQRLGIRAAVGSPIVVEGRLWGLVIGATSKPGPIPAGTEDRIADFTELVATAIANAESRAQLDVHAEQQAALRRVATLVAEDVPPKELFEAVAREVGTLLGGDFSGLARFEGNAVFPVGVWAADGEHPPFPPRWEMQPGDPATRIAETRGPIRSDDWTGEPGPIAEFIRAMGIRSTVGTPIVVEGRLWGALALHSKQAAPLPPDTEPRMAQFTDLVATAIANREARAEVTRLADEQAALRRVATLVVRGVRPNEIFSTVAMELRRLFGADIATVARFEEDRSIAILVGQAQAPDAPPLKTRWEVTPPLATAEVARTGRPARTEGHHISTVSGETADEMRRMGVSSAVASPIIVEGDLWGVITVSTNTEPLPPGADERVTDFTDLVATAIANAKSRSELEASRARVVAASAEERRRVVRDLHDGAQQRLVHAVISLKLALRELRSGDPHSEDYVKEALDHAEQANSELRELVHGILPGVLTSGGLRAGVEDLVSRGSLPVDVDVSVDRFPPAVEATAYFVVSEALTNAVKHADARSARVAARADNGALRVEVRDDGVGGADPHRGSGLTGLRDRVEALGGRIKIISPAGNGTSLSVEIPVEG